MDYLQNLHEIKKPSAICIGNFDGLHKGHQVLIGRMRDTAEQMGLVPVVLSFYPHPVSVVTGKDVKTVFTRQEKVELLKQMNVDCYVELSFTKELAAMSPVEFVNMLSVDGNCKAVFVGEGFRFGSKQSGDINVLTALGKERGITVCGVEHFEIDGLKVSTANLKTALADNDFNRFETFTGRKYSIKGKVTNGKKIGRSIGYKTVNIIPQGDKLLPQDGVYATYTHALGGVHEGMTNIGTNPTLGGAIRTVETNLFGFDGDLYEQYITVSFCKFLRPEARFSSIDTLKTQLNSDEASAKTFFSKNV